MEDRKEIEDALVQYAKESLGIWEGGKGEIKGEMVEPKSNRKESET